MTTPDSEPDPQQLLNHAIEAADENDDGELQGALKRLRADAIERGVLASGETTRRVIQLMTSAGYRRQNDYFVWQTKEAAAALIDTPAVREVVLAARAERSLQWFRRGPHDFWAGSGAEDLVDHRMRLLGYRWTNDHRWELRGWAKHRQWIIPTLVVVASIILLAGIFVVPTSEAAASRVAYASAVVAILTGIVIPAARSARDRH